MAGRIIAFEGCDQAGKETQCRLLAARLRSMGKDVEVLSFPQYHTPIGAIIKDWLHGKHPEYDDATIELLYSADIQSTVNQIKEWVKADKIVIIDRYYYSGLAYGSTRTTGVSWSAKVRLKLPRPDLSIFLDVPDDVMAARKCDSLKDNNEKSRELQRAVAECYRSYCGHISNTYPLMLKIDANNPPNIVHENIISLLRERMIIKWQL